VTIGDRRRVVIAGVRPLVNGGAYPGKATAGLPLEVSATMFAEGTEPLLGWVRLGPPERAEAQSECALEPLGQDRYSAWITPREPGTWEFAVIGLVDEFGGWLRDTRIRLEAGQDVDLDLRDGARLAELRLARPGLTKADRGALESLAETLKSGKSQTSRVHAAGRAAVVGLMRRTVDRSRATEVGPFPLWVDRERAGFSAWYEMFPRSEGAVPPRSGTFSSAAKRLGAVAAMGFDVLYLPPIHPIGTTNRKGRNNALASGPDDPGSPWAIGSAKGGHDAVDPALGTIADFDAFVARARRAGLEVALDYALQCSPDHPWVREHPEWFRHRVDASIRYAENPPKRYQDIYPIDFESSDAANLWIALRDVMLFWIEHGVRIFRVDNPHTKSFRFWEWLIGEVHRAHPDVLFLSEAFTRPAVMQHLARLGFSQSYTYFTWRNAKWELSEYLYELSQTELVDFFRPNFWVNTPDILHAVLQHGGAAAFRLRAVLAAITCPSWGMYSGYELVENVPAREGSEEYLDSEKYQLRPRNWEDPHSIAPFITQLNAIRRRHAAAIAQLSTLRLHHIDGDYLLCVSRSTAARDDVLLLVVNLDPFQAHEAMTWLDLGALGLAAEHPFEAHDELTGATYVWQGSANFVRLDPAVQPAHILHLRKR